MSTVYSKVFVLGEWEPELHDRSISLDEAARRYARAAKEVGCTSLQINFLDTPYHPLAYSHPEEYYLYFDNYGASLDMFAESSYSRGMYPRFFLEKNLERLRILDRAAGEEGLTSVLYVAEPRHVPEALFRKHPGWRGPRVDNPSCSMTPLYALDTDLLEVRDHYSQMLQSILGAAENLQDIIVFVHDSGAGFSHSEALYAGANGPFYNSRFFGRGTDIGGRIAGFCDALVATAKWAGRDIDVALTSQLTPGERAAVLDKAGPRTHVALWGEQSRTGGMEDQWALGQVGPEALERGGYDGARDRRRLDFEARAAEILASGRKPRMVMPGPNEHYLQNCYVPNPWEQLEILQFARSLEADQILFKGLVTQPDTVRFNINQASLKRYLEQGESPEESVSSVVRDWIAEPLRDRMEAGLRAMERAVRERPGFHVYAQRDNTFLPGPLVPNPIALTEEDRAYYWHPVLTDYMRLKGGYPFMPNPGCEVLRYALRTTQERILPLIDDAMEAFAEVAAAAPDEITRACAEEHRAHAVVYACLHRSLLTCIQMLVHWRGHGEIEVPTVPAIVDAEIENTRAWIACLGEEPGRFLRLGPVGVLHGPDVRFASQLHRRIEVMQKHREDATGDFQQNSRKPAFLSEGNL